MRNLIKQLWLLLTLAVVFGAALAFTDQSTKKRIADNRQKQIRMLAQQATLGELEYTQKGEPIFKISLKAMNYLKAKGLTAYEVLPLDAKGSPIGYALIGEGIGWDQLLVLVGLSPDLQKITGLEILQCRETPGLGERVKTPEFREQYKKSADKPLILTKEHPTAENQVQALTGATISSTAVTDIVNATVKKARELIHPDKK
jgi:electron transport complex protein RnfG